MAAKRQAKNAVKNEKTLPIQTRSLRRPVGPLVRRGEHYTRAGHRPAARIGLRRLPGQFIALVPGAPAAAMAGAAPARYLLWRAAVRASGETICGKRRAERGDAPQAPSRPDPPALDPGWKPSHK